MKTKRKKTTKAGQAVKPDLYAAVDLHGDNGLYCVINEQDQRVFEARLPNHLDPVLRALEPYRARLVHGLAVESTFNWYWLVDGLHAHGYGVQLVNPNKVRTYDGLKHSDDQKDAFHLAHLQRLKLLPLSYIYPQEQRPARDQLRRRMKLVAQRTAHVLSFKSLVERQTGRRISANKVKALEAGEVRAWLADKNVAVMGQVNLRMIECLQRQITVLEQAALAQARLAPAYERLLGLPGIGQILAMVISLESGPMARFTHAGNYVSYGRGVKSERLSNERKKGENNRKCGNQYLAWAYVEAATFAIRYHPQIKAWYQRKLRRCGGLVPVALKAVAAKLAKAVYYMVTRQEGFKIDQVFP